MEPSIRRSLARPALGLLLFLALFLPAKLWRASSEASVWMDEVHSIVLTARPVPEIVHLLAGDAHPPLYFLSLKAWLRLGREIGETGGAGGRRPGVLWARLLNVLAWLLTAGIAWWLGRRVLGHGAGALVAASIAGGAAAATVVQDLRPYAFAWGALVVAYLLLVDLLVDPTDRERPDGGGGRNASAQGDGRIGRIGRISQIGAVRWALLAVVGALALWSHLLTGVVLASLVITWLVLTSSRALSRALSRTPGRSPSRGRLGVGLPGRGGLRPVLACLAATAGMALLAAPWLVHVPGQWEGLRESAPTWMTPATPTALLRTFVYWLPLGRLGSPQQAPFSALQILGLATILLPVAGAAALARRGERSGLDDEAATRRRAKLRGAAALGLGSSILSVLILWLAARTGLAPVFHGPRYPLLAAGPWAGGLAALAVLAALGRPARRRPWLGWLLMSPWLLAGLVAPIWSGILEDRGGLPGALEGRALQEVHVLPAELIPIFRHTFAGHGVQPVDKLPCDLADHLAGGTATVLDLNPWHRIDRGSDQIARQAIATGRLSHSVEHRPLAPRRLNATLYRLAGPRPDADRTLCTRGFARAAGPVPAPDPMNPASLAVALPTDQRTADGWSYAELRDDLVPYRWSTRPTVRIRLHGTLRAGRHTLHLVGVRLPQPQETARLRVRLAGAGGSPLFDSDLGPGPFHLRLPLDPGAPLTNPVLTLHHPTWSPAQAFGNTDPRRLGFQFVGAWVEVGSE